MKFITAIIIFTLASFTCLDAQQADNSEATRIVEFTNTVVAIGNAYSTTYRNYETFLDNCRKAYARYAVRYNGEAVKISGGGPFYIPEVFFEKYTAALDAVPEDWSGKRPITQAVTFARDTTAMLEGAVTALRNYFEQGRFARDNFKSYQTLTEGVVHYFESTQRSWNSAVAIAMEAGREAELELLSRSPRAGFLIPMKTDLDTLSNIIRDIFNMADDDYDFGPYKKRNKYLEASIAKNRSVGDKDVSEQTNIINYTMFYEYMSTVTKALSGLMTELERAKPNGVMINSYINQINTSYEAAINRYNNF